MNAAVSSHLPPRLIVCAIFAFACGTSLLQAQSPPVDLTELSLERLLGVRLIERPPPADELEALPLGNVQLGYRYAFTLFEDYLEGTRDRTAEDVLADYPVSPNRITQQAHILSLSYRASETVAWQLEAPFIQQETDHIRRSGDPFTIKTEGIGDILALGIRRISIRPSHQVFAMGGISFPTGSINETGDTPRGKGTVVPYTMQIGSGTYDLQPGLLYIGQDGTLSWGVDLIAKFRLGRNDNDYSLGNRGSLSTWLKTQTRPWLEPHLKLTWTVWDEIHGRDPRLDPTVAPVADPECFGGSRVLLSTGADFTLGDNTRHQWRLGIEAGLPVYQDLNGPQPAQQYQVSVSATKGL